MKKIEEDAYTIHTGGPKDRAQLVDLACRNCGGTLELVDRTHAVCPYCGQKYLIDEAKGTIVDIHVDYGDNAEVKSTLAETKRVLSIFLGVVVLIALVIFGFNIAARKSVFSSSDRDIPVDEHGELLAIFCKDVFGKEIKDITEEEFASIRYIKCGYVREKGEDFNAIWYSYTDYQDCESEEEFQETVQRWYYRTKQVSWPSDYTKFTGLTRIDTTDAVWLSLLHFSPECKISYVETDNNIDTVNDILNPAYIKVLHIGIMGHSLEGIGAYKALEELVIDTNQPNKEMDISGIEGCPSLKRLHLRCADTYKGLAHLSELPALTSLYINHVPLPDCGFLKDMPQLEELSIDTGTDPDLSPIAGLTGLKRLYLLDAEYISQEGIGVLSGLKALKELKIAINDTGCIQALAGLTGLEALDLHMALHEYADYEQVPVDVSPLAALENLETIQMDNFYMGEFVGLEGILGLPSLKAFWLGRGVASEAEPLFNVGALLENPSVEELHFQHCYPKDAATGEPIDFGFLTHYPNVKALYLDDCDLTDVAFLEELKNLRVVSLQENGIDSADLRVLSALKKLELVCVEESLAEGLALSEDVEVYTDPYYLLDR